MSGLKYFTQDIVHPGLNIHKQKAETGDTLICHDIVNMILLVVIERNGAVTF